MTTSEHRRATLAVPFFSVESSLAPSWKTPLDLQAETIHIWGVLLEGTDATVERCGAWLDAQEQARAARFVRADDSRRYRLAHGSLRALLGRYLRLDPQAVEYQPTTTGKPLVSQPLPDGAALTFNLSHSHGRMLIAVSRERAVGVDLEPIRRDVEVGKLADRFFCRTEQAVMRQASSERAHQTFFRYWVAKEAALKAQGIGIASLQDCEILLDDAHMRADVLKARGSTVLPDWTVQFLSCGPGWEGAVASVGRDWIVQPRSFD